MDLASIRDMTAHPRRLARELRRVRTSASAHRHNARVGDGGSVAQVLTPGQALAENGFTVFRSQFSSDECGRLATAMKQEAGIEPGTRFTNVDAANRFASPRNVLFDERILSAVRAAIGAEARFLQVSDLHYLHDTAAWHRDSVHRAHDSSDSADWSDGEYKVVKAILYLEADNAAMGIMCGSHLSPIEMNHAEVRYVENRGGQLVIGARDEPNRRFKAAQKLAPFAWKAQVGDVLVFDERMYHAGRRIENGKVNTDREAPKFTLSFVFGADNVHSERLYSYFRYARRELHYRDLVPAFRDQLADDGLLLTAGLGNYYLQHPEELRLVYLRNPEDLEPLIAEFSRTPSAPQSGR